MVNGEKILVLDGYIRNSLAILRSLGTKGYACDILIRRENNRFYDYIGRALKSKFVNKVIEVDNDSNDEQIIRQLITILENGNYNSVIAGGTYFSNLLSDHKKKLETYAHVLIEDKEKLQQVHDKLRCIELAQECNIPVPDTYLITSKEELEKVANLTDGNVVVKYADSCSSQGLVIYQKGKDHFLKEYTNNFDFNSSSGNVPFAQKLIDCDLIDTTAFGINGETIAVLSQQRLLCDWVTGGGGIVNITNDVPEIMEHTKKLIRKLNWTGHIELDWVRDKHTGKYYLLEINPKIWGTTQLTISAGYDYPYWFVSHVNGKTITVPGEYKKGLMYRWLDQEIKVILTECKSFGQFYKESKKFILRFFYRKCKYNVWWSDIKPFIYAFLKAIFLVFMIRIMNVNLRRFKV